MTGIGLTLKNWIRQLDERVKSAFLWTVLVGLLTHMQIMVSDIPNHDGLAYLYDSQNVVTSGRWFLSVACGISSYFTLPWLIGVLGILYMGVAAGFLVRILNVRSTLAAGLIGGLLATFPSLCSNFAYGFSMDGYMMSMALAVFGVYITGKRKWGWLWGGISLAFSMGIYQAYLPFAILLSLYSVVLISTRSKQKLKEKIQAMFAYLWMGITGMGLYFVILKLCLAISGKVLDDYQGIENISGGLSLSTLPAALADIYKDFAVFSSKSGVFLPGVVGAVAMAVVFVGFGAELVACCGKNKWLKSGWFYVLFLLVLGMVPLACGVIKLISPELNFHLLMRYQWVLLPIFMVAFMDYFHESGKKSLDCLVVFCAIGAAVLVLCYSVLDNVGYFNLNKKYEKTYAYCLRLLDRMEQAEGYYQGIPVALIGVVGDEEYPVTDLTTDVTGSMIGIGGDYLVYKAADYEIFWQQYLGATIHVLPQEEIGEIYYTEEYTKLQTFPAADSVKVIDGVLCIKTENTTRK